MKRIYFDHSATTPLDKNVFKKMMPYFSKDFANPASIHSLGQAALKAVEDARYKIAEIIGAKASEIIFTSGSTEANNLAINGLLKAAAHKGDKRTGIITTNIEHASIIEPVNLLKKNKYLVSFLPVDKNGLVLVDKLLKLLKEDTLLVSIGYVNSEIGSIQQIDKIGRVIRKFNERRYNEWLKTPSHKRGAKPKQVYFHTDATQAFNTLPCKANFLNVDLMSLSSHKVYGPKGVGLLFVKKGVPLEPILLGGHQERNLRSGTLNVPGIIGFSEALLLAEKNRENFNKKVGNLRDYFVRSLINKIPKAYPTIKHEKISSFHANIIFPKVLNDALLLAIDEEGIAASAGSACASGDLEASPVIKALGYKEEVAQSALRFTFGKENNLEEIKESVKKIAKAYNLCLKRLR